MSRLRTDRIPASVDEARSLVAYNERIIATSQSPQRRERAAAMLANVRPHLERLEREENHRVSKLLAATPPASTIEGQLQRRVRDRRDDEFEVVWSGDQKRVSLTGDWDSKERTSII